MKRKNLIIVELQAHGGQGVSQVWRQADIQVKDQVSSRVTNELWAQLVGQVWNQAASQVGYRVRSEITNNL
jgi:hypothetical protein